ncbi:outer membrane beta-barrel protein [Mucilaginibacter agri]|uniref:Outer membrane beta-barrel protein n=1 Tax=Mucilaginibacter agri TaxID=2695265 RepID=A0A966DQY8_9SPHI|nr:outer membrane beta-barrel protein [Mucilaginibacter agri]NCD67930.1 outer membrane beta-barrel protein [Mucilaginibacter agri]
MKTLTILSHRILFLLFYIAMFTCTAVAQKLELSANVNSGLFNYVGSSASNSGYYYGLYNNQFTLPNPYGTKLTASYGLNVQGQMIYKNGFIMGLQTGYDFLNSKQDLSYPIYIDYLATASTLIAASYRTGYGSAKVNTQFINLNPYFGYRIGRKSVTVDITGGADFGFQTANRQSVTIYSTAAGQPENHYSRHVDDKITDIRLKGGVAIGYKKFSLNLSYAHGLTNYIKNEDYYAVPVLYTTAGDTYSPQKMHAYSQLIRFGLGYRFY